jgi:hypothetical protein
MKSAPEWEVFETIRKAEPGKASRDYLSIDILKLATGTFLVEPGDGPGTWTGSPILSIITKIVNEMMVVGSLPDILKRGLISMVPKDLINAGMAEHMRPITLLHEFTKLVARLLANRITVILDKYPDTLSAAQRAYLKNGSIHQCLQTVLAVFESNMEMNGDLFVASYDVRKAFDSVQAYSIKAACERLNMPNMFIEYILKTMDGARSAVWTHDGPTEYFELMSGVRQGDPLSAILFVIVIDVLHAGFENNPLYGGSEIGFTLSRSRKSEADMKTPTRKSNQTKLTKADCDRVKRNLMTVPKVASAASLMTPSPLQRTGKI